MNKLTSVCLLGAACGLMACWAADEKPPVIEPGIAGAPPSDAIVLFDGTDLSQWEGDGGKPAPWVVKNGYMEVKPKSGSIRTKAEFGSVQLHVEWATPEEVKGDGQGRGNSGVYLQGRYEIQVLDSYENDTYAVGHAGAFYNKFAPLVNASRKPGEWQTYDIIFHPPHKKEDGTVAPGSFTVLHNGVLVQDHIPVEGSSRAAAYEGSEPKGPILLQDHNNPTRFRNIWVRPLGE